MTYLLLCDSFLLATGIPRMILTQVNRLSLVYTGQRKHSAFFPLTHFPYKVGLHLDPLVCHLGKKCTLWSQTQIPILFTKLSLLFPSGLGRLLWNAGLWAWPGSGPSYTVSSSNSSKETPTRLGSFLSWSGIMDSWHLALLQECVGIQ